MRQHFATWPACPTNSNTRKPVPATVDRKLNAQEASRPFKFSSNLHWNLAHGCHLKKKSTASAAKQAKQLACKKIPPKCRCLKKINIYIYILCIYIYIMYVIYYIHTCIFHALLSQFQATRDIEDGPWHHLGKGDARQEDRRGDPLRRQEGHQHGEDHRPSTPHEHTWRRPSELRLNWHPVDLVSASSAFEGQNKNKAIEAVG